MYEKYSFAPARRDGMLFHGVVAAIFASAGLLSLYQMLHTAVNILFVFYLLVSLVSIAIVPYLIYRLLALRGAYYVLERNGIRMHWGLRVEEIPMKNISWVKTESDVRQFLGRSLPLPWLHGPGAILGLRHMADGTILEFMAADVQHMVLVATPQKIFVLSPSQVDDFLYVFQKFMELGSLAAYEAHSQYPTFLLAQVWKSPAARVMISAGLFLCLFLFAWVSLIIPNRTEIFLGFATEEPSPPTQLLLLPLINGFFFVVDALLGMSFYRRAELASAIVKAEEEPSSIPSAFPASKVYAYLLWGSSILTSLLFMAAVFFTTFGE